MNFFIPSYQRGYRWTAQQVKELLKDIDEFSIHIDSDPNSHIGQFYCLQPLVVKKMTEAEMKSFCLEGSTWYEVVDGQQRLTTLYLLLRFLHQKFVDSEGDYPSNLFTIKYERKHESSISLDPTLDDVDSFHFRNAYAEIADWMKIRREQVRTKGKMSLFYDALVSAKIKFLDGEKIDEANNVRFIWYELGDNEDPIMVFTRLNIGKISLTNAELIKALLLKSSNFKGDINVTKLRQQEIASEWDNIEYTLQNEEFWLFLHEAGYDRPTRIDFIFDLICKYNVLNLSNELFAEIGDDEYRTFRYFYEYFSHTVSPSINECWEAVTQRFSTFAEWYDESEIYHYVDYLIACGIKNLEELLNAWTVSESKIEFIRYLKNEIKSVVCHASCYPLDKKYKEDGSDKWKTRRTLLFHNIQTVIDQNKVQKENLKYGLATFYKFPFHLYKLEGWDVEHISSNTTNSETDIDTQKEWLLNCFLAVSKDIQKEIRAYFDLPSDKNGKFKELKSKINIEAEESELSSEEKNKIWNYVLLDSSSNRSYGNAIFSAKRRILVGKQQGKKLGVPRLTRDKKIEVPEEGISDSAFVPPCTMNAFLKYYSTISSSANYWTSYDCQEYLNDIQRCIDKLFEEEPKKN